MTLTKIQELELDIEKLKIAVKRLQEQIESHKPRVYGPMPNSRYDRAINRY